MAVECNGSTLVVTGQLHPSDFIVKFEDLVQAGHKSISIEAHDLGSLYPNIDAPIAATVSHYKILGTTVTTLADSTSSPMFQSIFAPMRNPAISRVCEFTQDSTYTLVDELIEFLKGEVQFAPGSIDALIWCLYEVMDNVVNHSGVSVGFMELQLHKRNKRLAICIADSGRGIRDSLSERRRTASDEDAITVAMEYRMTRNAKAYQGNGLWGLNRFVQASRGVLTIASGSGHVSVGMDANGQFISQKGSGRPGAAHDKPGTIVDFQIPYDQPIDFEKVTGQAPVVQFSDRILEEDNKYILRVASQSRGYATRRAGAEMYNKTVNYLRVIPVHIELDFESIGIVSSSFADEFVAKLVKNMGFVRFNELVRITNTEPNVRRMIDQAVQRRLGERASPMSVV